MAPPPTPSPPSHRRPGPARPARARPPPPGRRLRAGRRRWSPSTLHGRRRGARTCGSSPPRWPWRMILRADVDAGSLNPAPCFLASLHFPHLPQNDGTRAGKIEDKSRQDSPSPRFTVTGLLASCVLPMPSWPLLFEPQHLTPPPEMSKQVCWNPRARAVEEISGETGYWEKIKSGSTLPLSQFRVSSPQL